MEPGRVLCIPECKWPTWFLDVAAFPFLAQLVQLFKVIVSPQHGQRGQEGETALHQQQVNVDRQAGDGRRGLGHGIVDEAEEHRQRHHDGYLAKQLGVDEGTDGHLVEQLDVDEGTDGHLAKSVKLLMAT